MPIGKLNIQLDKMVKSQVDYFSTDEQRKEAEEKAKQKTTSGYSYPVKPLSQGKG